MESRGRRDGPGRRGQARGPAAHWFARRGRLLVVHLGSTTIEDIPMLAGDGSGDGDRD